MRNFQIGNWYYENHSDSCIKTSQFYHARGSFVSFSHEKEEMD